MKPSITWIGIAIALLALSFAPVILFESIYGMLVTAAIAAMAAWFIWILPPNPDV